MKETIKFYRSNDPYGFLNNFKKAKMFIYNHWWNNVESAYQAMKCVKPEDFTAIWQAKTPREARDLGQTVSLVPGWNELKYDVMYDCVLAKFTQNHDLLRQLLATDDAILVENSPTDYYWGCGADGSGSNNLGRILMDVREKLKGFNG